MLWECQRIGWGVFAGQTSKQRITTLFQVNSRYSQLELVTASYVCVRLVMYTASHLRRVASCFHRLLE